MKITILKIWICNLLISIVLFYAYAIVLKQTESEVRNWVEYIFSILLIMLEYFFATVFLAAMVVFSFTYFLNSIVKIRNNYFLSFLTFLGLPIVCTIFLFVNVLIDIYSKSENILKPILILSVVYLFIVGIEFLIFRRIVIIKKKREFGLENKDKNS